MSQNIMTMLVASYLQKEERKLTLTQDWINTERANHFLEKFIIKATKNKQKNLKITTKANTFSCL